MGQDLGQGSCRCIRPRHCLIPASCLPEAETPQSWWLHPERGLGEGETEGSSNVADSGLASDWATAEGTPVRPVAPFLPCRQVTSSK